ncbi:flagellar biosynthesis protein FlhB [Azorhizobium oxalatiphilum]|uniref:Flagellar biosynthetic protein FlhB n=1 Tax=Azorhizobium oxalatiphilum TaxID=980631 RepID=A0A917BIZ3_9HYPH|nr:flagellar biosynthesis protein FlhB [Azorhizobium oxalatiphilum]GGF47836.1 flagellar biosynthesis protein FlhB [Azorhizobium oxalatiphilum]
MADDTDKESKTEEASEKKISDALEKGNVPFSREAALFAGMLGILAVLTFFVINPVRVLTTELTHFLDDPAGFRLNSTEDAVSLGWGVLMLMGQVLLPAVLVLGAAGLIASLFQNTPRLVLERIKPQFSRINPVSGAGRIFGKQGFIEFGKSTFKFLAIAIICGVLLYSEQGRVINAMYSEPLLLPSVMLSLAVRLVSAVCVATIVLVALDLVWSRFHWRAELRMSKQEVKDEHKQAEGDPMVKARMRSLAMQRARQRMISAVPKASLVIANPTHYAIAMYYDRQKGGAPLVVAKGTDLIALKIREIAERHDIPIIEDKPLARAMYDAVQVDQWIPQEFYRPVAKILYFIYSRGSHAQSK